jgi:hypothetical protein
MMKRVWFVLMTMLMTMLITWLLSGAGAVAGSVIGSVVGPRWLLLGAVAGGVIGTVSAAYLASKFSLIRVDQLAATALGGLIGFWVAASVAVSNLHTPVVPVVCSCFTGVGAFLGALYSAGARTNRTEPRTEPMTSRNIHTAIIAVFLLLPALVLCSCGLLGLEPPAALIHPVSVMGGLFLAFVLNALAVFHVRFGHIEGTLVARISLRFSGNIPNLAAFALCCVLFATITAYVFLENFRPH